MPVAIRAARPARACVAPLVDHKAIAYTIGSFPQPLPAMRRSTLSLLPLLLLVTACDDYTAPSLYQATTPECKTWTEGSRFELPRGISVYATPPVTLKEGGTELALIFTLPVGTQASFTRLSFLLEEPHKPPFGEAKVLTIYQRGMNRKAEIVDVIEKLPIMFAAVGNSKETQWRLRLQLPRQLPQRFDLSMPDMLVAGKRYPVRTFTYRYFPERSAYGMCS